MDFLLGFIVGTVCTIAVCALIIIVGVRRIDKLRDELEELEKDDGN